MPLPDLPRGIIGKVEVIGATSCQTFADCPLSAALRIGRSETLMRPLAAIYGEAAHGAIEAWAHGEVSRDARPTALLEKRLALHEEEFRRNGQRDMHHFPIPASNRVVTTLRQNAICLISLACERIPYGALPPRSRSGGHGSQASRQVDFLPNGPDAPTAWTGVEVPFREPTLRISGKIDLLEFNDGRARIIDHKTGFSVMAEDDDPTLRKYALQLSIYGLVIMRRYRIHKERIELAIWAADGARPVPFDPDGAQQLVDQIPGSLDDPQAKPGHQCQRCGKRQACSTYLSDGERLSRPIADGEVPWTYDVWGRLSKNPERFPDGSWQVALKDASGRDRLATHLSARHGFDGLRIGDGIAIFGCRAAGRVAPGSSPPAVLRGSSGERLDASTSFAIQ